MRLTITFLFLAIFCQLSLAAVTPKKAASGQVVKAKVKSSTSKGIKATTNTAPKVKAKTPKVKAKTSTKTKVSKKKKNTTKVTSPGKTGTGTGTNSKVPSVPGTACAIRPKKKVSTKPTSAKTRGFSKRAVAGTQFHATCKDNVDSLKASLANGGGKQQNPRIWPNEFTFTGGFYVTTKKEDAELFGTIFLAQTCLERGGVSVIELTLDMTGLNLQEPTGSNTEMLTLGKQINKLGKVLQKQLGVNPLPGSGVSSQVPSSDVIANAFEELDALKSDKVKLNNAFKGISVTNKEQLAILGQFATFKDVDVVQVTTGIGSNQKTTAAAAKAVGIPEFPVDAFNQVVLVTDKAMSQLAFKSVADLDPCLAALQPKLIEKLEKDAKELEEQDAAKGKV